MLIIIEGTDGAGKSTLVRELITMIETLFTGDTVQVMHAGPPKNHPLKEYEEPLFTYRPNQRHHIICDRWHIGEWIYPSILNRRTYADHATWRHIDMFLASRGAVIVHVDPSNDIITSRLTARGDDVVTVDQAIHAAQMYRKLLWMSDAIQVPIISPTMPSNTFKIDTLIEYARAYECYASHLNQFTTYVGPHEPEYLILGDVRGHLKNTLHLPEARQDLQPAFMPYAGTSGQFLLAHLPSPIVTICGLANSYDVDDLASLISALNYPKTIALGKNAWNRLERISYKHNAIGVPHPQYIRRFYSKYGLQYGIAIQTALHDNSDDVNHWLTWRPKE